MAANLLTNPSFEVEPGTGLATGWAEAGNRTGTPVYTLATSPRAHGLYSQRIQYTGVAGDSAGNKTIVLAQYTPVGSFAAGDPAVFHASLGGALVGCTISLLILAYQDTTFLSASVTAAQVLYADSLWRGRSPVLTCPANTNRVRCYVQVAGVGTADTVDLYVDAAKCEKASFPSPFSIPQRPVLTLGGGITWL